MGRIALLVAVLAACGTSGGEEPAFDSSGGMLEIGDCGYAVTTKPGAETPQPSGSTIGSDPTPVRVHLGFIGDPKTSIIAQWRTTDEDTTASVMRYGVGANLAEADLTTTVKGIEFRYKGTGMMLYRMHQAHACGLTPGTAYSYEVGDGKHWSAIATFQTAPDATANPDAEVTFGFLGDSRLGEDVFGQLATLLQTHAPDVILFSGDAVLDGLDQTEWDTWLDAAPALLASTPIVMADGNHEDNAINFYAQFAMPGDQENYGLDYGFAHITVANDTPEDASMLTTTTLAAIQSDFTASAAARWKVLMNHQPLWSTGATHGSNLTLQASWGPAIDQAAIDLVLNGHEHSYQISYPLLGGVVQPSNATGTTYVVAGGAGAQLYGFSGTAPWSAYNETTYSASVIDVRRDQMTLTPYRQDGTAIPTGYMKTKQ
ncbi:MAG TPA: metallophosphoesterase family protein [Kofleriaceae bacterium]|jgi:hypothetical protein